MERIIAVINLGITGFYLYNIFTHMIQPGTNVGYTRMLMFACLATIPLVFMMVMVGGRDRWPYLMAQARDLAGGGFLAWMLLIGLSVLLVLMPVGMLVGVWFGMGLRFGALFLLYFVPVFLRLALAPTKASIETAVGQVLLFFASFLVGIGVVMVLGREAYEQHLQIIWPGYGDAAKMFFSVCIFAMANQLMEFRHALYILINKR